MRILTPPIFICSTVVASNTPDSLSEEGMKEMIKTAVEAALEQVKTAALDQSIKDVLRAAIKECSVADSTDR